MRIPKTRLAAGLGASALWGVLLEAAFWAVRAGDPLLGITRAARMERALEVGAFTALTATLGTLLCLLVPPLRRRLAAAPVWIPSAFGLAAGVASAVTFLGPPPAAAEIRLSQDALLLRSTQFGVGLLIAAGVAAIALLRKPPRWLHGAQAAATGLAVSAMLVPGAEGDGRGELSDVFLISVDTLRADHLGCYGYPLPTSPEIDAFCQEAVVYEAAMAPAASTIPSYTSLMSGTLQNSHGVYTNFDKADDSTRMLAERLREVGYRTAAILEGTFPGSFANIGQGFDLLIQRGITASARNYAPSEGLRSLTRGAASIVAERLRANVSVTTWAAERWLRSLPHDVPVFAHFYWPYPHSPYTPPPSYLERVSARDELPDGIREPVHLYDAEIRFTDAQVGRVLDALRRTGRYDDAWIVFTSDHGEELGRIVADGPDGPGPFFGHSRYLFDSSVRVPLAIKPPRGVGGPRRRESAIVSTASVASTLLDALGLSGVDELLAPLPGFEAHGEASGLAFSIARNPSRSFDRASVRRGAWRLIETRRPTPGIELLRYRDGEESADRSEEEPETARELTRLLHTLAPLDEGTGSGSPAQISERERRMLEELGYVE